MRLIDADKAKNSSDNKHDATNFFTDYRIIDDMRRFLDLQPTVEAQPIVHACWIESEEGYFSCSNCHNDAMVELYENSQKLTPFCSYCGAIMDKESNNA